MKKTTENIVHFERCYGVEPFQSKSLDLELFQSKYVVSKPYLMAFKYLYHHSLHARIV